MAFCPACGCEYTGTETACSACGVPRRGQKRGKTPDTKSKLTERKPAQSQSLSTLGDIGEGDSIATCRSCGQSHRVDKPTGARANAVTCPHCGVPKWASDWDWSQPVAKPSPEQKEEPSIELNACVNGHPMKKSAKFCSECGKPRATSKAARCAKGHRMEPGSKFCSECGSASLASQAAELAQQEKREENRSLFIVLGVVVGLAIIIAIIVIAHVAGGTSQSYDDGWNSGVGVNPADCNATTAPGGDNQQQWTQGCNDGTNAYNNWLSNGSNGNPPGLKNPTRS